MNGNAWILIGIITSAIAAFSLPYGFHLKSKESQLRQVKEQSSVKIAGDVVGGDKVEGDQIVVKGNINLSDIRQNDRTARMKIAKVKINREFEDFNRAESEIIQSFKKETNDVANKFNAHGTLSSGIHIQAQMELSQKTKEKVDRLWVQMNRNIEDILIENFGQTSFDAMIDELLIEHNKRSELYSTLKEIYHFLEDSPKSWEMRIFKEERLTKDFKLK